MFLVFALLTSIITVVRGIRIIARRWVGRVLFPMLTALFFFLLFFFFGAESDDDDSNESDDDGSGSRFTSGSFLSLRFELSTYRVI